MFDCRTRIAHLTALALVAGVSCSNPTDTGTSGSIVIVVDSIPENTVGGVWLTSPGGARTYSQVGPGLNSLISRASFGAYGIAFDTIWIRDKGTVYDGSRWTVTPIELQLQIDRGNPVDSVHTVYRKVTGGISVSSTGYDYLWVEFLYPDGTGCRCTAGGGAGFSASSSGGSVQNLLPGEYQVHFLPITFVLSPHTPPPYPTYVPSPSIVTVTVRAGELAHASAVYTRQ